jgi:hypothetical protein
MKTCALAAVCILLTGIASFGSEPASASRGGTEQSDSPVVSKLRQLEAIRERQAELEKTWAEAGRVSPEPAAAVALAEARIDLARELGQHDIVLAQLQKIVELRRDWLAYVKRRAVDRVREAEVYEAEAAQSVA